MIAILIGSGTKKESAVELSKKILSQFSNNLNELAKLSVQDLTKFKGIGEAKAISIATALELGRRRAEAEVKPKDKIVSHRTAFEMLSPFMSDLLHEEFWIICLNRNNRYISKHKISSGGISGTVADMKMIFNVAVKELASAIILCHNHPSGNLQPSEPDKQLTRKAVEVGKLLDVTVLDHIIIAHKDYYSFADNLLL